MENQQLTPGQTNLQQSSNNLQQVGTPATSSDTTDVLNRPLQTELQVRSAQTQSTDAPQTFVPEDTSYGWLLVILLIAVLLGAAFLWNQIKKVEIDEPEAEPLTQPEVEPLPQNSPVQATKKPKHTKKTTRRQRTRIK